MKYDNGKDIFPEKLLRQIQKYISGRLVYIPANDNKREWGETSGHKRYLLERNHDIRIKFAAGASIEQLSNQYYLSDDSIKKIVYSKKEIFMMDYKCTLSSAKEYAENEKLEEWIHAYLLSDGHNKGFSEGLKLCDRYFIGPIKMPLSLFTRCCGPEENMKWQVGSEWFEKHVAELMEVIKREQDMPPLIVNFFDSKFDLNDGEPCFEFELNDGNHRFEAYSRLGFKEWYFIVWITEQAEYEAFISKYSEYLR